MTKTNSIKIIYYFIFLTRHCYKLDYSILCQFCALHCIIRQHYYLVSGLSPGADGQCHDTLRDIIMTCPSAQQLQHNNSKQR